MNLGLGPEGAVEGDAETVGFIPDTCDYPESLGIAVEEERIGIVHKHDFFKMLCKTHVFHLLLHSHLLYCLPGEVKLAFASVDNHQLRQVVRSFFQHSGVAAVHNFLH